jgi:hypothetical protein
MNNEPKNQSGYAIEKTRSEPGVVGRVTSCAPRLQPEYTNTRTVN